METPTMQTPTMEVIAKCLMEKQFDFNDYEKQQGNKGNLPIYLLSRLAFHLINISLNGSSCDGDPPIATILKRIETYYVTMNLVLSAHPDLAQEYLKNEPVRRGLLTSGLLIRFKQSKESHPTWTIDEMWSDVKPEGILNLKGKGSNESIYSELPIALKFINEKDNCIQRNGAMYKYDFWPGAGMEIPPHVRILTDQFINAPRFIAYNRNSVPKEAQILIAEGWSSIHCSIQGSEDLSFADNKDFDIKKLSTSYHPIFQKEQEDRHWQSVRNIPKDPENQDRLQEGNYTIYLKEQNNVPNKGTEQLGVSASNGKIELTLDNCDDYELIFVVPYPDIQNDPLTIINFNSKKGKFCGQIMATSCS